MMHIFGILLFRRECCRLDLSFCSVVAASMWTILCSVGWAYYASMVIQKDDNWLSGRFFSSDDMGRLCRLHDIVQKISSNRQWFTIKICKYPLSDLWWTQDTSFVFVMLIRQGDICYYHNTHFIFPREKYIATLESG